MWKRKNRCPNCNAPLAEGTTFCHYCDLNPQGASRAKAAQKEASRKSIVKIVLGLMALTCCLPLSIFIGLSETVYAVRLDEPMYTARAPPLDKRPTEPISVKQVFLDMRDTDNRTLDQRKKEWLDKYAGHWVSWKGVVTRVYINDGYGSDVNIKPEPDHPYEVQTKFDPINNPRLKQLSVGQEVQVSGKLWGYDLMSEHIKLSEGALVEPGADKAPGSPP